MPAEREGQVVTFYSFKGGTGRTMAVANVAWILAANGKRVLVADWDLESPGLHRFFAPFLNLDAIEGTGGVIDLIRDYEWEAARERQLEHQEQRPDHWIERYARVNRHAFSLRWDFPGGGGLDFLSAGRQNNDYAVTVGGLDWDTFYNRLGGAEFFEALRADMKQNYDYTLIDSRTGLSDVADICTLHLPDTLVDCFTLSDQGIDGAARVAGSVRDRYKLRDIRILPVPMRVDQAEKEKAEAGRALAMRRFAGLPSALSDADRRRYWAAVEVPYRPFYAYEETLATFGDPPGSRTSLLAAFETLAAYITDGEVSSLPPMDEALRLREKARFERRVDVADDEIVLRHAPEDALWAEWIERVLVSAGVRVVTAGSVDGAGAGGPSQTLTVVSHAYLGVDSATLPARDPAGQTVPLAVYVSDLRPLAEFPAHASTFLAGLSATTAADRLLRLVGRPGPVPLNQAAGHGMRYPGTEPAVFRAPVRNARFTGRDDDLAQLRGQLRSSGSAVVLPVALQGMGGVGKTQLALEYVHRFKSAYDLVWWVQADPPEFVDTSLADLGSRLELPVEPALLETVRAVLQALSRNEPYERWLLVYDNAEEIERVAPFLPQGGGHVLLTSRNRGWGDHATPVPVDVFDRAESVTHLRQRVTQMTAEEADRVAETLGDLPIAVAAAGAWLADTGTPVGEYLQQIERHGPSALSVEATWDLSINRLAEQGPAAYRLLQLCSVLAPEIALEIIYSDEMAEQIVSIDPSVSERLVRGALVQQINRLALLKLDVQGGQIQIHRLLQAVVRDRMSSQEQDATRHQAHLVLAGSRPAGEVDNPETWRRFRAIWPHLEISRAVNCPDEGVRQLLIDRLRYLWRRGGLAQAEEFSLRVEAGWEAMLAGMTDPREIHGLRRQLLHLRNHRANVHRDQGRYEVARQLDQAVLDEQRELIGVRHPHILMTSGSLAADLRALGQFSAALDRDRVTYAAWSEIFGEDHPRTLAAANNLAASHRAVGDFRAARSRDEEVLQRRRIVLGPTNPYTLHSASMLGRDLREAGEYEKSVSLLRTVYDSYCELLGPDSAAALVALANLAASVRAAGRPGEAAPLLDAAYETLRDRFGAGTPDALSCRLSRAVNLLAIDDLEGAESEARAVADAYESSLGPEHPHTLVCVNNLAVVYRGVGQPAQARRLALRAAEDLDRALGPDHPYTLAAATNVAVCLLESAEVASARAMFEDLVARASATLGPDHPDTIRCLGNLELADRAAGGMARHEAAERLAALLGPEHPTVTTLRRGSPVHRTLDPHPY
ncbi:FxSxx-COOH system tetratricopeptide repeat protein [Plantactinospora sp. KBS50]|uniref:FxSxx-COOH system tetratricopeptide repeat protein n=1 Tax=Plantactinospora sp. KBS50 TaxID=2024580 RepID=UPI000BAAA7A1|nr:FxSxx-COOH system tetratricopeptide repeat protein [Plantactinospora sp. KBS50]ASW54132.1 hypothetical protein CIK06_07895 [Plantactinospora sp. KBS50]